MAAWTLRRRLSKATVIGKYSPRSFRGDAEKLSALIQEWGLKQVNSVVEIIKTQIDIIEKLEQVLDSNKVLEIDVHSLVEGGSQVAAIVETCGLLKIPLRAYLGSVLLGLADFPIKRIGELSGLPAGLRVELPAFY